MVTKSIFVTLADGAQIDLYKITNKNGACVSLQTLGAGIQSLYMPDKNGTLADVVLGFDNPQDYTNPDLEYQGLVVGRWANRIRDAKFTFNGKEYKTPMNQGSWTLHGGGRFSFTPWDVEEVGDDFVTFSRFSPDGEDGFGGNFTMKVKYTLTDDNTLRVEYTILCDEDTVANPTNHAYFNLSGNADEDVQNHYLKINADYFATTLTISPLKNAEKINAIGESIGEKYGVKYLPSDFKKKNGYKRSIELSREYNLYRQNFCGCIFSKTESSN